MEWSERSILVADDAKIRNERVDFLLRVAEVISLPIPILLFFSATDDKLTTRTVQKCLHYKNFYATDILLRAINKTMVTSTSQDVYTFSIACCDYLTL